jgi:hypothetical protein
MSKIAGRLALALVAVAMCVPAWPAQGSTISARVHGAAIPSGNDPSINNMDEFDKSLDPVLAGTLAGLALVAATFLIAYRVNIQEKIDLAEQANTRPNQKYVDLRDGINTAVGLLVGSFYAFVVLLAESLSLDKWVEPHALLSGYRSWLLPLDISVAGGTLAAAGIVLLGLGAKKISSIVA